MWHHFICIFEFLDHIKLCKLVLKISKVNIEYNIYILHILILFEEKMWKNEDTAEYINRYGKSVLG